MKLKGRLASRKLWIAVGTALAIILVEGLGIDLPKEAVASLVVVVASYILGQSWVDAKVVTPAGPMPSFAELDKLLDEARAKGWTLHRTIDEGIARGIPLKE